MSNFVPAVDLPPVKDIHRAVVDDTASDEPPKSSAKPAQHQAAQEQQEYLDLQGKEDGLLSPSFNGGFKLGRIVGGNYVKQVEQDETSLSDRKRPLETVDFDLPLTYTKHVQEDGDEYILLTFPPDDTENPYNWPAWKKAFLTAQLCSMTLVRTSPPER